MPKFETPPMQPGDLSAPEQILLGATRLSVSRAASPAAAYEATQHFFGLFGIAEAAPSHATLLHNASVAATRQLEINCLCASDLTSDEARIVHAVGHAQAERMAAARKELGGWLSLSAIRMSLPALAALGATMSNHSLIVDVRPWSTNQSPPSPAPHATVPIVGSNMVH